MVGSRASDLSVLYVSEAYTTHDRRFLAALSARLKTTAWLCLGPVDGRWESRPVPSRVTVLRPDSSDGSNAAIDVATMANAVRRAADAVSADLVHAGPVPTGGLASVRAVGRQTVAMSWGSDVLLAHEARDGQVDRVRETLAGCGGFVADARCVEEAATSLGLPSATPRAVFPWGVEAAALAEPRGDSEIRRRLAWMDAHVCISTRAWKGAYRIDVLLDGFEAASQVDPALRLLLLGDGEASKDVRARTAAWAKEGRVVLPGHVPAGSVRPWLEAADVYVSSVPSDGSSISLLEAMAAGLPAVVIDACGNREWVERGQTGWLVPPNDPGALAKGVAGAFESMQALRAAGDRARDVVLRRGRWEENVEALFRTYEAVIARHPAES